MSGLEQWAEAGRPSAIQWFPLLSQQLRFRSLTHVYLYHPTCQGGPADLVDAGGAQSYYLTFHETALSSPFLTTPPARQQEDRLVWPELERPQNQVEGGAKAVVVRLWAGRLPSDGQQGSLILTTWGLHFSGLVCLGDKLMRSLVQHLEPNTLVFKLHGHFFIAAESFAGPGRLPRLRFVEVPHLPAVAGKRSYNSATLGRMHRTLRALWQRGASNDRLKAEILSRGLDPLCADVSSFSSQYSTSLRLQIFTRQNKLPATKKKEIALHKSIESLRLQVALLQQEKQSLVQSIQQKRQQHQTAVIEADKSIELLTESFHSLSKDREKLTEWLKTFEEFRVYNSRTASSLATRRKQLISQLCEIFPIHGTNTSLPTIGYVCLPASDHLKEREDTELAVALGWTAHLTSMVSSLLSTPTRYPILHYGSRSVICDNILDKIPDREREFPLYPKGVERMRFEYAVYLLNKNIAQLRWHCDASTADLRPTLANLYSLLESLTTRESEEPQLPAARLVLPVAPAVLKGVAPVLSRGTPTRVQQQQLTSPVMVSGSPRDRYSDSESVSSSKDSDGGGGEVAAIAAEEGLPVETESVSAAAILPTQPEEPKESGCKEPKPLNSILFGLSNGLYEFSEEIHEEPVHIKERSTIATNGTLLPPPHERSVSPTECAGSLTSHSDTGASEQDAPTADLTLAMTTAVAEEAELPPPGLDCAGEAAEVAVAADLFWDSVTSRAQVLSVPTSFKISRQKPYSQY